MLPADGVVRAALRWLRLLRTAPLDQAAVIIRSSAAYTDLTMTQYSSALDWLKLLRLVQPMDVGQKLPMDITKLSDNQLKQVLFSRALEADAPPWLPDADLVLDESVGLPSDATDLAATLELADHAMLAAVRAVHGRLDLAKRKEVGSNGELALADLLDERWPGSVAHIALQDDGFGYDLEFTPPGGVAWHLEVKTTTRRGRLVVHVSRHEFATGIVDSSWRLVLVGLSQANKVSALGTLRAGVLRERSPQDRTSATRWELARYDLSPPDLEPGLTFVGRATTANDAKSVIYSGADPYPTDFAWMPTVTP